MAIFPVRHRSDCGRSRQHDLRSAPVLRRGFTLVELLIVVAIIVTIIATLLPAFASVRRSSRVTADLANLRMLQAAHLGYATDFGGYLADARLPHGGVDQDIKESFVTTLKPYYDSAFALRSPIDNSPHWPTSMGGANVPLAGSADAFRVTSYGLNNFLSREFSPASAVDPLLATDRLSKVSSPGATVHMLLMAETGDYAGSDHVHVETWGGAQQAAIVATVQVSTAAAGGLERTGEARSNWSFLDGHAATLRFGSTYIDQSINRFDPSVSGLFDSRTGGTLGSP
ncbi:MAG: prepilin-type N-terminal cleavage/methylation domain-containing protein [Phycisphaerae bacterium]|jgi:prepilin-type N-terminal cleavage/methylation domain-containing protein/prepilin-type processing-associated H-X9-DG protein|nr:prepilin-type N-terminal cleavage/methylation domain-containing protein [Phycisphaerae bacterium]